PSGAFRRQFAGLTNFGSGLVLHVRLTTRGANASLSLRPARVHGGGEADHIVGGEFLEGVARPYSPLHRHEGALDRRGPGLTGRFRKRGHVDGPRAIAEIESVQGTSAAQSVCPKIAHGSEYGHRLSVKAVGIAEQVTH